MKIADEQPGDRLYRKGGRVSAPDSAIYWRREPATRRERHRAAKRAFRAGRMDAETLRYILSF